MTPLVLLLVSLTAPQKVESAAYDVVFGGKNIGIARAEDREATDGSSIDMIKMTLTMGPTKLTMEAISKYDKAGRPVSTIDTRAGSQGKESVQRTYGKDSVSYVRVVNGQKESKTIAIPKGARLDNAARLWFKKVMPKPGASATFWRVGVDGKPKTMRYVYKGPEQVKIGSKTYATYRLDQEEGSMWVDKKRMPIKMEKGEGARKITLLLRP
jgi:hypothetical protein